MPLLVTVGDGAGGSGDGSTVGLVVVRVGCGLGVALGGVALGRRGARLLLFVVLVVLVVLVARGAVVRDAGAALVDTADGTALGLRGAARPARVEATGLACTEPAGGLFATAPMGGATGSVSAVASNAITVTRPSAVVTLSPAAATRLPRAG